MFLGSRASESTSSRGELARMRKRSDFYAAAGSWLFVIALVCGARSRPPPDAESESRHTVRWAWNVAATPGPPLADAPTVRDLSSPPLESSNHSVQHEDEVDDGELPQESPLDWSLPMAQPVLGWRPATCARWWNGNECELWSAGAWGPQASGKRLRAQLARYLDGLWPADGSFPCSLAQLRRRHSATTAFVANMAIRLRRCHLHAFSPPQALALLLQVAGRATPAGNGVDVVLMSGDSMMRQLFLRLVAFLRGTDTPMFPSFHRDAAYIIGTTGDELRVGRVLFSVPKDGTRVNPTEAFDAFRADQVHPAVGQPLLKVHFLFDRFLDNPRFDAYERVRPSLHLSMWGYWLRATTATSAARAAADVRRFARWTERYAARRLSLANGEDQTTDADKNNEAETTDAETDRLAATKARFAQRPYAHLHIAVPLRPEPEDSRELRLRSAALAKEVLRLPEGNAAAGLFVDGTALLPRNAFPRRTTDRMHFACEYMRNSDGGFSVGPSPASAQRTTSLTPAQRIEVIGTARRGRGSTDDRAELRYVNPEHALQSCRDAANLQLWQFIFNELWAAYREQ